jgi:23S rRNA pseudouridine1911/1915/1917 synthase
MLHAAELGFVHPETGEELRFESPLPADIERVLAWLRK